MSKQVFLTAHDFAERYGKGDGNYHIWIARRAAVDSRFPKVVFIGHRKYFRLEDIESWERACAADPAPRSNAA